jgi:hypothetical protein
LKLSAAEVFVTRVAAAALADSALHPHPKTLQLLTSHLRQLTQESDTSAAVKIEIPQEEYHEIEHQG